MALAGMASRFAVLPDDDNTDWIAPKSKKGNKSANAANAKGDVNKKPTKPNSNKNEARELQALAFGGPAKKKNNKKKSSAKVTQDPTQFDAWKQKDAEFTEDQFVSELEQAILQSKIDFEEKKAFYTKPEPEKSPQKTKQEKQAAKKPLTVSLDEFNTLATDQLGKLKLSETCTNGSKQLKSPSPDETNFFEKLDEDTRKALTREQLLESYRQNQKHFSSDGALMEHFKSSIEEKNVEIAQLQSENGALKDNLSNVKKRYKTVLEILKQCEMREKAEIVVENDKLKNIREELSGEVTRLTKELEQMKTRVADLSKDARKNQGGKRMSEHKTN